MNREYLNRYKSLLKEINKKINISYHVGLKINLTHFSSLKKGKLYANSSCWEIPDLLQESYFISFINSYEIRARGVECGSSPGVIDHIEYRQIAIFFKSNMELPNLIIRPFYLGEKIANVFLKFDVKLYGREKFNSKYVLESKSAILKIEHLLSYDLTAKIALYDDFNLEIINSEILLKFESSFTKEKAFALFEIARLLDKNLKNQSVL